MKRWVLSVTTLALGATLLSPALAQPGPATPGPDGTPGPGRGEMMTDPAMMRDMQRHMTEMRAQMEQMRQQMHEHLKQCPAAAVPESLKPGG